MKCPLAVLQPAGRAGGVDLGRDALLAGRSTFGRSAAADSEFVRRLNAFRTAVRDHVAYLCRRAADLEPALAEECRELAGGYAAVTPESA